MIEKEDETTEKISNLRSKHDRMNILDDLESLSDIHDDINLNF